MPPLFDNIDWVAKHPELPKNDLQTTFRMVTATHPLGGCAFSPLSTLPKTMFNKRASLQTLALLADAVTTNCYEVVGHGMYLEITANLASENITAVGNYAFVALHHSQKSVRNLAKHRVDTWRVSS